jgi:DeoR/GlpR family transcriptional regulator of sugar metabolism
LADSSKIGGSALVRTGSLADFDSFITDNGVPGRFLQTAKRLTSNVIVT